jgi:hypothetical protein
MSEVTPHLGVPRVAPTNNAAEDAMRLRQALQMVDTAMHAASISASIAPSRCRSARPLVR